VAFEAKSNVRTLVPHPPLTIIGVHNGMLKIAKAKGEGAAKQKQAVVEKMLVAAKGEETRYLVRSLCQNNRVGAARTTVLTALARSIVLTSPPSLTTSHLEESRYHTSVELLGQANSNDEHADKAQKQIAAQMADAEALIKKTFVQRPDYETIVTALLEGGLDGITDRVPLTVGEPIRLDAYCHSVNSVPQLKVFRCIRHSGLPRAHWMRSISDLNVCRSSRNSSERHSSPKLPFR
jgi:DNA ligase 1